jgi:general secretion pathway protein I
MTGPAVQRRSTRGFTLLETLVAFMLLSLALALIFQIFSAGLRNGSAAEQHVAATIVADGVLHALDARSQLEIGEQSGEDGPFSWRLEILPAAIAAEAETGNIPPEHRLLRVDLQVQWSHGNRLQQLEVSTLRLGNADG